MRSPRLALVLARVILAPSWLLPQAPPVRLSPGECRWEREPNVVWGHRVLASSSEEGYGAKRATGRPDVFPDGGPGSDPPPSYSFGVSVPGPNLPFAPTRVWSPSRDENRPEWIRVSFRRPIRAHELWVFVTGGAGAEMRISVVNPDESITPVADLMPERWPDQSAQIVVPLDTVRLVNGIRVEVEPASVEELVFLDAVAAVPRRVCLPAPPAPGVPPARVYPPSYWFEGAAIGAAVLGATTVFMASAFCGYDDSDSSCHPGVYVGAAAVGGALGAGVGALVGGFFDAPRARPLRGHPGRAALIGAVAGGVWGVGFLCHGLGDGCGSGESVFGISVSAVGALAGWLVAR